ncbi:uncharacterized protein LOC133831243 [Humulus lupulus]|uniref:uncharacterized protein LOC133831243 n=1 Tax=Humulus lupulus TaxID=3486 RepID=UPI002B40199C|nr:uncharacterized protein LOC133831243 [Humulus lupulus]XP_062117460.1 uncharacterized protein LOC133831243 [Humulus lupulus]XP_062117461.1 uncharacterized protein LOC133831243 [Humulus lupulus]XP_062117462.1 uncharacterized protein LOC133831243 [Humulus lupulus]XP_062117463.1 uncharacterized protein LOC133831243 [Humulus lupulus]XP_062117464.1 uncharacterized protein LOC133831243 [Humulus lupulus]
MGEKKGHKSEKHEQKTFGQEKDEKEFQKGKEDNNKKADKVVETLKTTCLEGGDNTNIKANERKEIKEKKKHKEEKKKKEGIDGISSLGENCEDDKIDGRGLNKNFQDTSAVSSKVQQVEKKKKKKKKEGVDGISSLGENVEDELVKVQECNKNRQDIAEVNGEMERSEKKKKKRDRADGISSLGENVENCEVDELVKGKGYNKSCQDTSVVDMKAEHAEKKKKRKREMDDGDNVVKNIKTDVQNLSKKKRKRDNVSDSMEEAIADNLGTEDKMHDVFHASEDGKRGKSTKCGQGDCKEDDFRKDKKKKKVEAEKQVSDERGHKRKPRTNKDSETAETSENPTPQVKSKRVTFSDHVEVYSPSDSPSIQSKQAGGLVQGKRFTPEEDEMVKAAVLGYIAERDLGDEGLDMVLNCKSHPEVKNCWKTIALALPWRPRYSVYYRAHMIFERSEIHKWTPEEYEYVLNFHKEHGADWKKLSKHLKKHRLHVKDTFRRIKFTGVNKGRWSQDEYAKLFDLVNMDLRLRASEEKKVKHGMLRDNICWEAISQKLSTRHNVGCCSKWYKQLTSPMVVEGLWDDTDDYRLLDTLSDLDAACIEDVDWDNLLEHRTGDICRKRWSQMVKHIGDHVNKPFSEQVEVLSKRYSVDVLAAREEYDSKEPVDC